MSQNNQRIKYVVKLCSEGTRLNDNEFVEFSSQAGYWGSAYLLPEEPTSSYVLIRELIKRKIANPEEILMRYESQLTSRHSANPHDRRTLDLLSYLYDATGNYQKLKKIDLHGWKNLKIQRYAESYISRISTTSPEYSSALADAANDFPHSVRIQRDNLSLNYNSDKKIDFLAKFVAAQFANVSHHLGAPDRLGNFMTSLKNEMISTGSLQSNVGRQ